MSTRKDKKERVKELEEQIKKIWAESVDDNYELVAVTPDGGGVQDYREVIAISRNKDNLIVFCENMYSYSPALSDTKPSHDKNIWATWYHLRITDVIIVN